MAREEFSYKYSDAGSSPRQTTSVFGGTAVAVGVGDSAGVWLTGLVAGGLPHEVIINIMETASMLVT
jgi:hypothetical protein